MLTRSHLTAFALSLAVMAGCSTPGAEAREEGDAAGSPALTDPQIAHVAVTANAIDIEMAQLVESRTRTEEVRGFARTMITDHTAVNERAAALAERLGVTPEDNPVSRSLRESANEARERLEGLSGAAFDRRDGHRGNIVLSERNARGKCRQSDGDGCRIDVGRGAEPVMRFDRQRTRKRTRIRTVAHLGLGRACGGIGPARSRTRSRSTDADRSRNGIGIGRGEKLALGIGRDGKRAGVRTHPATVEAGAGRARRERGRSLRERVRAPGRRDAPVTLCVAVGAPVAGHLRRTRARGRVHDVDIPVVVAVGVVGAFPRIDCSDHPRPPLPIE